MLRYLRYRGPEIGLILVVIVVFMIFAGAFYIKRIAWNECRTKNSFIYCFVALNQGGR